MSDRNVGNGNAANVRAARTPLGVRIVLIVGAVLLAVVAGVAAVNLSATATFNRATDSLNANIKAAQSETADADTLHAQQQQTDAQFEEAGRLRTLLLPQVRDAIDANASVSAQLTKITQQRVEAQQGGRSGTQNAQPNNGSSSSKTKKGGSLTDEQKKQVEELMKANQQSTDSQSNTTDTTKKQTEQKNNGTDATKPW